MLYVAYALSVVAMVWMGADVVAAVRLKKALSEGGEVGQKWSLLTNFLIFFFVAYVLSPLILLLELDIEYMSLMVFGVFVFGAAFVWIVIGVLKDTLSFLNLLK